MKLFFVGFLVDYMSAIRYGPIVSTHFVRLILLIMLAAAILTLSLLPEAPRHVRLFMGMDKVQHWIAYAGLGFLVLLTIHSRQRALVFYFALSVFSCTMYGGLIEILQGFTGRTPETADFFVNMFGAASGGVFAIGFIEISRNTRRKERKGHDTNGD